MAFLTFSLYVPTFFFPLISFHYTPLFFCIFRKPLKSNLILWDFYPRTFSNIVGMIGSNSTQTDSPQTGLLFFLIAMSVFSWQVLQPYTKRRSTRLTFNGALSARHQKQAYLPYTKRRPYQPYIERRHNYLSSTKRGHTYIKRSTKPSPRPKGGIPVLHQSKALQVVHQKEAPSRISDFQNRGESCDIFHFVEFLFGYPHHSMKMVSTYLFSKYFCTNLILYECNG